MIFSRNREIEVLQKQHRELADKVNDLISGRICAEKIRTKDLSVGLGTLQFGGFHRVKTANETVNNSTVLQDDDHLNIPSGLGVNKNYIFLMYIFYSSSAVADLKTHIVQSGTSGDLEAIANGWDISDVHVSRIDDGEGTPTTHSWGGAGSPDRLIFWSGVLSLGSGGAGDGNIKLQWAQNTSEVSNTIVYAGSWMLLIGIS